MDGFDNLTEIIENYCELENKSVIKRNIDAGNVTIDRVRMSLMTIGTVLEEKDNIILAEVKSGLFNMNNTFVCVMVDEKSIHIVAVANEGLIKQSTCNKAIKKLLDRIYHEN